MLLQSVHRTAVKGVLSIFSKLLVLKKKKKLQRAWPEHAPVIIDCYRLLSIKLM